MEMTWNNVYPRPQLKRDSFFSLNGEWLLDETKIIVPFPPESQLSHYNKPINEHMTYEKVFSLPDDFIQFSSRVILHFGAVDQIAKVFLNNHLVTCHQGGYLPFEADITDFLKNNNHLVVEVEDTLSHDYPYGKQKKKRGGMWYTPVSGIWQSVWLEAVPPLYIEKLKITPALDSIHLDVQTQAPWYKVTIFLENETFVQEYNQKHIDISIENGHYWSVTDPYLYMMQIETETDMIESYFALRTVSINQENQVCLNQQPLFLHGVLDQGYFIDGLFLPKTPDQYKEDILNMKELGFNLLRKHIKIEPDIFYYYCDYYGILVMQDMVNNGNYHYILDTVLPNLGFRYRPDTLMKNKVQKNIFVQHSLETLDLLYNHPSIIAYTIFNEGWGQFEADKIYRLLKKTDPSRLYDATSGWFQQKESDFDSRHVYFKNKVLKTKKEKPILLSECGGYTRYIENHVYNSQASYGYGKANSEKSLTYRILKLYDEMVIPSIKWGLCGCIYTQLSDIEDEINGLYTYDRQICKVNVEKMKFLLMKIEKEYKKKKV